MQEQNSPSADNVAQNEQSGHMIRTPLYVVIAILSLTVLGLVGYVIWDSNQTDITTTQPATTTTQTREETESASESVEDTLEESGYYGKSENNSATFQYTYNGIDYTLYLNNPDNLTYRTEDQAYYGNTLIMELNDRTTLEIHPMPDIDQSTQGGAYGTIMTHVMGDIYRTRYFGDHYVLDVGADMCEIPNLSPCVIQVFHNDAKGALSAYIRYDTIPDEEILESADELIRSYRIEEG